MKTFIAIAVAAQLLGSIGISHGDGSTIAVLTGKCCQSALKNDPPSALNFDPPLAVVFSCC